MAGRIACGTGDVYLLHTNGDKETKDQNMTSHRLAGIRELEPARAIADFGIKQVRDLRHSDTNFTDNNGFRGAIVRAMRQYQPSVVLCPDPFRRGFYLHRIRRISWQATINPTYPYDRDHLNYPDHANKGLETHKVSDILLCDIETPDIFLDILDTVEQKISALKKHWSQLASESDQDVGTFVSSDVQKVGQNIGALPVEIFKRIQIRN